MTNDPHYQDMLDWFLIQSKDVQKHAKIIKRTETQYPVMLHIDKNTPKVFMPMMPRSATLTENNTSARITVAPTLMGCLFGYQRIITDFASGVEGDDARDRYRGGYELCELDYDYCIEPDAHLVFDAEQTGEHWLVAYNKPTLQYTPRKVGKLFLRQVVSQAVSKKAPTHEVVAYLQHNSPKGVWLSEQIKLDAGSYELRFTMTDAHHAQADINLNYVKIEPQVWQDAKALSASLLSLEQHRPPSLQW